MGEDETVLESRPVKRLRAKALELLVLFVALQLACRLSPTKKHPNSREWIPLGAPDRPGAAQTTPASQFSDCTRCLCRGGGGGESGTREIKP